MILCVVFGVLDGCALTYVICLCVCVDGGVQCCGGFWCFYSGLEYSSSLFDLCVGVFPLFK